MQDPRDSRPGMTPTGTPADPLQIRAMKVLLNCLAVGLGGVVGALARYGVGLASLRLFGRGFPVGTLFVNLTGSFLVGWFFAWEAGRAGGGGGTSDAPRLAVVVGFAG